MNIQKLRPGKKFWYTIFALNFIHIASYPLLGIWINTLDSEIIYAVLARINLKLLLVAFFAAPINWAFYTLCMLTAWRKARE